MARRTTANQNTGNTFENKADGFLRLEVEDANGKRHRIPRDVALYIKNHISEQLINKASDDAEYEFKLFGKVHVVDDTPKEDIKF